MDLELLASRIKRKKRNKIIFIIMFLIIVLGISISFPIITTEKIIQNKLKERKNENNKQWIDNGRQRLNNILSNCQNKFDLNDKIFSINVLLEGALDSPVNQAYKDTLNIYINDLECQCK